MLLCAGACPVNTVGKEDTEDDEELVTGYQGSTESSWSGFTEVERAETTEGTDL